MQSKFVSKLSFTTLNFACKDCKVFNGTSCTFACMHTYMQTPLHLYFIQAIHSCNVMHIKFTVWKHVQYFSLVFNILNCAILMYLKFIHFDVVLCYINCNISCNLAIWPQMWNKIWNEIQGGALEWQEGVSGSSMDPQKHPNHVLFRYEKRP